MAVDADTPGELSDRAPRSESDGLVGNDEEGVDEAVGEAVAIAGHSAMSPLRLAFVAGLVTVVALGVLSAWLGHRAHESQQEQSERAVYLQVAKQGALNLTTIDYQQPMPTSSASWTRPRGNFMTTSLRARSPSWT